MIMKMVFILLFFPFVELLYKISLFGILLGSYFFIPQLMIATITTTAFIQVGDID